MCRGIVLVSLAGLLLVPRLLSAQHPSHGDDQPFRFQQYLQLHVAGGRIAFRPRQLGQSRTLTSGRSDSGYRQQLQVHVRPPCAVVQYTAADPRGTLTFQLCEKQHLTIEWNAADSVPGTSVRYEQPRSGDVSLSLGGSPPREIRAPSLWHLLLCEPLLCRQHLLPLLEQLAADWPLAEQAAAIQAELLAAAAEADVASRERSWQKLVDELAGENFRRRQAADAALRQGGQSAAAFLRRLEVQSLSAEQRLRIEGICHRLEDGASDTPQRVAAWLLGDRALWLRWLAHDDQQVRIAAAEHLTRLTGRPIPFDPRGDEKTRELQLAEVARQIKRR